MNRTFMALTFLSLFSTNIAASNSVECCIPIRDFIIEKSEDNKVICCAATCCLLSKNATCSYALFHRISIRTVIEGTPLTPNNKLECATLALATTVPSTTAICLPEHTIAQDIASFLIYTCIPYALSYDRKFKQRVQTKHI